MDSTPYLACHSQAFAIGVRRRQKTSIAAQKRISGCLRMRNSIVKTLARIHLSIHWIIFEVRRSWFANEDGLLSSWRKHRQIRLLCGRGIPFRRATSGRGQRTKFEVQHVFRVFQPTRYRKILTWTYETSRKLPLLKVCSQYVEVDQYARVRCYPYVRDLITWWKIVSGGTDEVKFCLAFSHAQRFLN